MSPPDHKQQTALLVLFILRFVQLGAVVLTGFVAVYLAWWHYVLDEETPGGLVVLTFAMSCAFFESFVTSAHAISKRSIRPNYELLLRTTATTTILSAFGYHALRQVPYVRSWCEGNKWAPATGNVEKRNCPLVCVVIASGAVAVLFTGMIALFAGIGSAVERRQEHVTSEDLPTNYTDDEIAGYAVDEKIPSAL
ncbi:MAG: hypothetical protein M1839_001707 [Geoglossum umbratile]|nr:MAG: hypothetical protein M1839_001707 [Geoglossum umbratile]